MIAGYVKNFYQEKLVLPVAKKIPPIPPNIITLFALLVGLFSALFGVLNISFMAVFFMFLSGYLNSLDGAIAQLTQKTSKASSIFNIVSHRIVEFLIMLSLLCIDSSQRSVYVLFMLGSSYICVTSFLVIKIFSLSDAEKKFHSRPGLMERLEVFLFFALMFVFHQVFNGLAILFTILVLWTCIKRINEFVRS